MNLNSSFFPMWQRLKPVFALVLLAPLIAEYLLGSLSLAQWPLFPLMALIYGGGALFVREATRRSERGWPTIFALGAAYAVVEEGLATQSLFNPHYLGLRLLDNGYIPALGIGGPWTAYVIVLHVFWSIAVPIGLVEAMWAERRTEPWLRGVGFGVSGVVYGLGAVLVAFGTRMKEKFSASPMQLGVTALVGAGFVIVAFLLRKKGNAAAARRDAAMIEATVTTVTTWTPAMLGIAAFVAGSAFHLCAQLGKGFLSPTLEVAICLGLPAAVLVGAARQSRASEWGNAQVDALMLGGLLAYGWLGFFLVARLHGAAAMPGQVVPCAIMGWLMGRLWMGKRQTAGVVVGTAER